MELTTRNTMVAALITQTFEREQIEYSIERRYVPNPKNEEEEAAVDEITFGIDMTNEGSADSEVYKLIISALLDAQNVEGTRIEKGNKTKAK